MNQASLNLIFYEHYNKILFISFFNLSLYVFRDTVRFLFELFCEVSPGDHLREPYVIRKYPETYKNEEELKNIPKFTFPCQLEK